jgi:hypothetical protein
MDQTISVRTELQLAMGGVWFSGFRSLRKTWHRGRLPGEADPLLEAGVLSRKFF